MAKEEKKEEVINEFNFAFYDSKAKEMIELLVKKIKGDKSVDVNDIKDAKELLRASKGLMREHNSRMNQVRNNKKFQWDIFNSIADEKDKAEIRKILKVDVSKLKLLID